MDLEADLGIDSIKRVEILSALQERLPDAPAVKPEHLGTLRTLRQIAEFLAGRRAGRRQSTPLAEPMTAPPGAGESRAMLLEVVAEKTGYPAEMLELDMGWTPTWASTPSSASRSCPPCRSGCQHR